MTPSSQNSSSSGGSSPADSSPAGTVQGLAVRPAKRAPMQLLDSLSIDPDQGVVEDYGQRSKRQVTLISKQAWQQVQQDLNAELVWHTRRANILIDGMDLRYEVGTIITIGECELRMEAETVPCEQMDKRYQGLRAALQPEMRGGVLCSVIQGGSVKINDEVRHHEPAE